MNDKKEQIEFLEWLIDDDSCGINDKMPEWAKSHIEGRIQDLNSEDHEQ